MKFIFIGGTYRGHELLKAILAIGHKPELLYILKEDDHEEVKYSSAINSLAAEHGLEAVITKKLGKADYEKIDAMAIDFAIVCGWRTILNTELTPNVKLGYIAAHDSLLPKYRGFAPVNWAIINGEKEAGVTLFLIEYDEVDSGRVISQKIVPINLEDYGWDVYEKVTIATIDLYLEFIELFRKGIVNLLSQDESEATYTCKRTPTDGRVDWQKTSLEVYNLIRALAPPYPGAYCFFKDQCYIIHSARLGPNNQKRFVGNIPGRVIGFNDKGIEVLCNKGSIIIELWRAVNSTTAICPSDTVKSIAAQLL
jgi:methionyl-tRNA formyltransferase